MTSEYHGRANAVADPRLGEDVPRGDDGFGLDLLAQRSDQHAQVLRLIGACGPQIALRIARWVSTRPGCCARYVSSSNSFGVSRTSSPSLQHAEPLPVDDQTAAHDRARSRRRTVRPPQRGADARQQFLGAERLRDVVVGAGVERAHLVAFGAARRQHQDRHARASGAPAGTPRRRRCPAGRGRARSRSGLSRSTASSRRPAGHRRQHLVAARAQQRRHRARGCSARRRRSGCAAAMLLRHRRRAHSARDRPSRTCAPPGTFSAQIRPPAAASSPRVIDSPMPVPNVACRAARPR